MRAASPGRSTSTRARAASLALLTSLVLACETPASDSPASMGSEPATGESSSESADPDTDDLPDMSGANFIAIADEDTGGDEPGEPPTESACEAFANAPHLPIIAATSPAEAATAAFVPDPAIIYDVTLPEDMPGYVQLEIAGWGTIQAFYTSAEIDYVVSATDDSQFPYPRVPNTMCPEAGITEQRIGFPHWDPALVEFAADGPRLVPLLVIEE